MFNISICFCKRLFVIHKDLYGYGKFEISYGVGDY